MTETKSRYLFPVDDLDAVIGALANDADRLVLVTDVLGNVQWVNQTVAATCGVPRDAVTNVPLSTIFPQAYVDERVKFIREAASTGRAVACEGLSWGLFRRTTFRPLRTPTNAPPGSPAQVLVVCRPKPSDEPVAPAESVQITRRP